MTSVPHVPGPEVSTRIVWIVYSSNHEGHDPSPFFNHLFKLSTIVERGRPKVSAISDIGRPLSNIILALAIWPVVRLVRARGVASSLTLSMSALERISLSLDEENAPA